MQAGGRRSSFRFQTSKSARNTRFGLVIAKAMPSIAVLEGRGQSAIFEKIYVGSDNKLPVQ